METVEKIKFLIVVYNNTIEYKNEIFQVVLDKKTTSTWKKTKVLIEELKKKYSKTLYPTRKIIVKEKFREGWKEILKY